MDLHSFLCDMRRPKILIRAARLGLETHDCTARRGSINTLLERERALEDTRRAGGAGYRVQDHVQVLTAILSEAARDRLSAG